ncbi:ArdC-like ssDNA-binding domain-containing protein [Mesorhizobium sp. M0060]
MAHILHSVAALRVRPASFSGPSQSLSAAHPTHGGRRGRLATGNEDHAQTGKRGARGEVGGNKNEAPRASLYCEITDRIIADLERGSLPWVKPFGQRQISSWLAEECRHRSQRSGINILILWGALIERGHPGQNWLTFRQALSLTAMSKRRARLDYRSCRSLHPEEREGTR